MCSCSYIVGTLDLMVSENYLLVYLCAMAPRNKLPSIKWLHQCYISIDRRYAGFTHRDSTARLELNTHKHFKCQKKLNCQRCL